MNEFGDRLKYLLALFTFIFIVIFIKNLKIDERTENVSPKAVKSELPPVPKESLKQYEPQEDNKQEKKITIKNKREGYYGGTSRAAKSYGQKMFERNK